MQRSESQADRVLATRCCIIGGGPAGVMLGLLLARNGVDVVVLEKHGDFLRDFRGDTIHPSTLEVMHELGLLEALLQRPHQRVQRLMGEIFGRHVLLADFSRLRAEARFVALMPQWDFLDFLSEQAKTSRFFHLYMESEVEQLLEAGGRIAGVLAQTPNGRLQISSDLTVGADGRDSLVRRAARLDVQDLHASIDVLWFRVHRDPDDASQAFGYVGEGVLVTLDRGSYWQCAFVIPKGSYQRMKRAGIESLREAVCRLAPFLSGRMNEIADFDSIHLLSVRVDRLRRWARPGVLCLGDAAHAMSPVGGVGINLAIQDAVAAANLLVPAFRHGPPSLQALLRVQRRRELPTRLTQRLQIAVQRGLLGRAIGGRAVLPLFIRLLMAAPALSRLPARLIGLGVQPERVQGL